MSQFIGRGGCADGAPEFSLAAAVFSVLHVLDIRRPLPPFAEDAEDAEDVEDGGRLKTDGGSI